MNPNFAYTRPYITFEKEKGSAPKNAKPLNCLGWLMGLEPTTTRITIYTGNPYFMRVCGLFDGKFSLRFPSTFRASTGSFPAGVTA
jgi:hypothetical protein